MRLAAIYILEHDFLFDEPQIINFGGKYLYDINCINNDEIQITRKLNHDFIDDFWGENISLVSAIVGSNGSGKTNICKEIRFQTSQLYVDQDKKINKPYYFFIYEQNNETILEIKFQLKRNDNIENDFEKEFDISENIKNVYSEVRSISLDFTDNIKKIRFSELKTRELFVDRNVYYFNSVSPFHQKHNISRQLEIQHSLDFLSDEILIAKINETYGDINFFKKINIETNPEGFNFKSIEYSVFKIAFPEKMPNDVAIDSMLENDYIIDGRYFFFSYLDKIFRKENDNTGEYDLNGSKFYNRKKNSDKFFDFSCQLIARVFFKIIIVDYEFYQLLCRNIIDKITHENLKNKQNFLIILNEIKSIIIEYKKTNFDIINTIIKLVEIIPVELQIQLNLKNLNLNKEIINTYRVIIESVTLQMSIPNSFEDSDYINRHFLIFKETIPISDGERYLIKLFSTIHDNKKDIKDLIILDEPEMGFHPLWKKKFVKAIVSVLPLILDLKEGNKIQIIFTTHDALTLSDMPNKNIIYISKNIETGKSNILDCNSYLRPTKSFGANITDLLSDSFFINDGLMGDFAKNKIQEVINWLNSEEIDLSKKDNYKKIIEIIDEPILRRKLSEMYSNVIEENLELEIIEKEIEALVKRKEEIKNK